MKKSKSLSRSPFLIRGHQLRSALLRLQLSLRDIEALLFERGVALAYETIRSWCDKFGGRFAHWVSPASTPSILRCRSQSQCLLWQGRRTARVLVRATVRM